MFAREPYISAKEPCNSAKQSYNSESETQKRPWQSPRGVFPQNFAVFWLLRISSFEFWNGAHRNGSRTMRSRTIWPNCILVRRSRTLYTHTLITPTHAYVHVYKCISEPKCSRTIFPKSWFLLLRDVVYSHTSTRTDTHALNKHTHTSSRQVPVLEDNLAKICAGTYSRWYMCSYVVFVYICMCDSGWVCVRSARVSVYIYMYVCIHEDLISRHHVTPHQCAQRLEGFLFFWIYSYSCSCPPMRAPFRCESRHM